MDINFSSKLFNPLYWHLRKYMADESIRYIYIYGGASAAKTYSVVQAVTVDTIQEADSYIVLRKFGSDIEDSIYSDFVGIIDNWKLNPLFTCIKNRIKNVVGGYVRFRGLDDSEKIKGIAKFKRVILEEMTQFNSEDHKQVRKRLRGRAGQQIIGLWNPVSEEHWIKKTIIDVQEWTDLPKFVEGRKHSELSEESFVRINKERNTILIKTTYLDNFWIVGHPENSNVLLKDKYAAVGFRDEHVIADFEADRINDYPYYMVYALGEWGKLDTGAEFYKSFSPQHNVEAVEYDSQQPLHLVFDENVNPYLACQIWQADDKRVKCIDEIALESPRNTLEHTTTEFIKRYKDHAGGVYIYGDATSRKADAKLQKGYNFFTLIAKYLEQYSPQTRVPMANPPVMVRGMFINKLFAKGIPGCEVIVGSSCKKTIEDLRYTKEAADGTKLKEKVKDAKTGVTYEKYGHFSDDTDYFLSYYFANEFSEFKTGSKTQQRIAMRPNDATIF